MSSSLLCFSKCFVSMVVWHLDLQKSCKCFFNLSINFGVLGDPRCPVWRSETITWGAWQRCGRSFDLLPGKFGGVENVPTRHFVDDPLTRQCWMGQIQHQCTRKTTYFIIFMHEIWCNHLFPNLKTETTHARPDELSQVSNTDLPGWVQTYQLAQCPWLVKQVMTRRAAMWMVHNDLTNCPQSCGFPMHPPGLGWVWETISGTMQPMAWRGLGEGTASLGRHTKTQCFMSFMFNHEFNHVSHRFPSNIDKLHRIELFKSGVFSCSRKVGEFAKEKGCAKTT